MNVMKKLLALLLLGLTLGGATRGEDGAALGDWGHFLSFISGVPALKHFQFQPPFSRSPNPTLTSHAHQP